MPLTCSLTATDTMGNRAQMAHVLETSLAGAHLVVTAGKRVCPLNWLQQRRAWRVGWKRHEDGLCSIEFPC